MLKVTFRNVDSSQLAKDLVTDKFEFLAEKFPDLKEHRVQVYLSMENSVTKSGLDAFTVKVVIDGKKYGGIILQRENPSLYGALDNLMDIISDRLNNKGDKKRVKSRNLQRKKITG